MTYSPSSRLELRLLRYFVAIVEYASMSKAANHLHVAQPALSQHVRRLETELQVLLLDRSSKGVAATDAGLRLYKHAKLLLASAEQLLTIVNDAVINPIGEVRLGMSGTVSELVSVPVIEKARTSHPSIRIRPVEAMSGYVLDWLRRGEVDVALIYATPDLKSLTIHRMLTEDLVLCSRPELKLTGRKCGMKMPLAAALQLDLITPGLSHGLRQLIEQAALSLQAPVTPRLEVDSYSQIKKLIHSGAGYGILPETAIMSEVKRGSLCMWRLDQPPLRRCIYLAYSSARPLSAAARAVARLVWDVTHQLVVGGVWIAKWEGGEGGPPL